MTDSTDRPFVPSRSWKGKFQDAFRGLAVAGRGQGSFAVHGIMAALVVVCGFFFGVTRLEWCLLILCITLVLSLEVMNSSLESVAKAVDVRFNPQLGRALDMASGAVLVASLGAAIVGLAIFVHRLLVCLGWIAEL